MAYLYTLYQYMDLFMILILIIGAWSIMWKGFGLWRAAHRKSVGWFVAILILNTAGILPILYLIFSQNPNKLPKQKNNSVLKHTENKNLTKETAPKKLVKKKDTRTKKK